MIIALLQYAMSMYLAYVVTFVFVVDEPWRPNGPYGMLTCLDPHVLFGQICRDWTVRVTSSGSRIGFGAAFLVGFLVLALVVRRFTWVLLVVPFATIPYAHGARSVWTVTAVASLATVATTFVLETVESRGLLRRDRGLPLGLLSTGAGCALVASLLTGPMVAPLNSQPGLVTWPSVEMQSISCDSPTTCIAVGQTANANAEVQLHGGRWGKVERSGVPSPASSVACADPGDCIVVDSPLGTPAVEDKGSWRLDPAKEVAAGSLLYPYFLPTAACSPGGLCWAIFGGYPGGADSTYKLSFAVSERDGHWLPIRVVGPRLTSHEKELGWKVYVSGISCWSRSSCTVAGEVVPGASMRTPWLQFVQTETDGVWGAVDPIPPDVGPHGRTQFETIPVYPSGSSISCVARATCLLGGWQISGVSSPAGAAVKQEVDGRWSPSRIQPSTLVQDVACHGIALCIEVAGSSGGQRSSVMFRAEVDGRWQRADRLSVPGRGILISGSARAITASCPTSNVCYVAGLVEGSTPTRGLIARYAEGRWTVNASFNFGLGASTTSLSGLACNASTCWAIGSASWGHPLRIEGFAFPLSYRPPLTRV